MRLLPEALSLSSELLADISDRIYPDPERELLRFNNLGAIFAKGTEVMRSLGKYGMNSATERRLSAVLCRMEELREEIEAFDRVTRRSFAFREARHQP